MNAHEVTLCGAQWYLRPAEQCPIQYKLYFDKEYVCYWCGILVKHNTVRACTFNHRHKKAFFQTFFQLYRRPGHAHQTHQKLKHCLYHPYVPHRYMLQLENVAGVKQMYRDFVFEEPGQQCDDINMNAFALSFTLNTDKVVHTLPIYHYTIYAAIKQFDDVQEPLQGAFEMATAHKIYVGQLALCLYNHCVKLNLIQPLTPPDYVLFAIFGLF